MGSFICFRHEANPTLTQNRVMGRVFATGHEDVRFSLCVNVWAFSFTLYHSLALAFFIWWCMKVQHRGTTLEVTNTPSPIPSRITQVSPQIQQLCCPFFPRWCLVSVSASFPVCETTKIYGMTLCYWYWELQIKTEKYFISIYYISLCVHVTKIQLSLPLKIPSSIMRASILAKSSATIIQNLLWTLRKYEDFCTD